MSFNKNDVINCYKIGKKLGQGNFGTAYICSLNSHSKNFENFPKYLCLKAIHLLNLETLSLNSECKILKSISHPNILKCYDTFYENDTICLITEFCKAGDLDQYIKNQSQDNYINSTIDKKRIGTWLLQLSKALDYLHIRKILHRDLKTKNIFLRTNPASNFPSLVLGDFGVSKILSDVTSNQMATTFIGTPFYMSPEQLSQQHYNSCSDIWSLGCVFYEIVELKRAINASSLMQCVLIVTNSKSPKFTNEYFIDWQDILEGMMIKNPNFRSTTSEIIERMSFYEQFDQVNDKVESVKAPNNVDIEPIKFDPKVDEPKTPKQLANERKRVLADQRARQIISATHNRREEIFKNKRTGTSLSLISNIDLSFDESFKNDTVESYTSDKYSRDIKSATCLTTKTNHQYQDSDGDYFEEQPNNLSIKPKISYLENTFTSSSSNDTYFDDSLIPSETVDNFMKQLKYISSENDSEDDQNSDNEIEYPKEEEIINLTKTFNKTIKLDSFTLNSSSSFKLLDSDVKLDTNHHNNTVKLKTDTTLNDSSLTNDKSLKSSPYSTLTSDENDCLENGIQEKSKPNSEIFDKNSMTVLDQLTLAKLSRTKENCIKILGENVFYKVYEILLDQHNLLKDADLKGEKFQLKQILNDLDEKLKNLVKKSGDCMCVDELIYLENQCGLL